MYNSVCKSAFIACSNDGNIVIGQFRGIKSKSDVERECQQQGLQPLTYFFEQQLYDEDGKYVDCFAHTVSFTSKTSVRYHPFKLS